MRELCAHPSDASGWAQTDERKRNETDLYSVSKILQGH